MMKDKFCGIQLQVRQPNVQKVFNIDKNIYETLKNIMLCVDKSEDGVRGVVTGLLGFSNDFVELFNLFENVFSYNFVFNVRDVSVYDVDFKKYVDLPNDNFSLDYLTSAFISKYGNRKLSSFITTPISFGNSVAYSSYREVFLIMTTQPSPSVNISNYYVGFNRDYILRHINNKFYHKWKGLYDTIIKEYDVLKPFDITLSETSTDNLKTVKDTESRTGSSTDDFKVENERTDYEDNNLVNGFNSTTGKPSDSSNGYSSRQYETSNPQTSESDITREYERDVSKSRDYTRKGNIGNTSNAELIMQEREKLMFNLQNIIFEDIASVICRKSYAD